jgi:hypothetical protein
MPAGMLAVTLVSDTFVPSLKLGSVSSGKIGLGLNFWRDSVTTYRDKRDSFCPFFA